MATSTIFADITIDDPKKAEAFIDAFIASKEAPQEETASCIPPDTYVTDLNEIRRFMSKRFPDL